MDYSKIVNNSLNAILSENKPMVEEILDLIAKVAEDIHKPMNGLESQEFEQAQFDIVKNIIAISVLSSIHANKVIEIEGLKEREKELRRSNGLPPKLKIVKDDHLE